MKNRVLPFLPLVAAVGAATAVTFSGCGNSWLDTKERSKTPSALMFDAQKAYDQEDYGTSASLFAQAVAKDPGNVSARIGWSFALNGQAGLSLTQIMQNIIEQKAAASLTGSTTGITSFVGIVGLNTAEKTTLTSSLGNSLYAIPATTLRATSNKLGKLNESWKAICPVLPSTVYTNLASDDATKALFSTTSTCAPTSAAANNAALFAAAIGLFGQAAALYQMLDMDSNGTIDIVTDVDAKMNAIKNTTGTPDLTAVNSALTTVNSALSSELIPWTLAAFKLLQQVAASIDGLPQNVKDQITNSTSSLDEAQAKLAEYKASAGTSTTGTAASALTTKLNENTSKINDAISSKISTGTTQEQTQAKCACANWDALILATGSTATKPTSCTGVTAPSATECSAASASLTGSGLNLVADDSQPVSQAVTAPQTLESPVNVSPEKVDSMYLSVIELFQLAETAKR